MSLCSQIRLSGSSRTYFCQCCVLLKQVEQWAASVSAVDTAVAYSPYPARIAPRRCVASRTGYVRSPLAAVYVLSVRKGSETPQSPFGSSDDWERCDTFLFITAISAWLIDHLVQSCSYAHIFFLLHRLRLKGCVHLKFSECRIVGI